MALINDSVLSDADFNKLSAFIYTNYGIKLPITKKTMLQSRLLASLKANNIDSFKEYCQFVLSGKAGEAEIVNMIDLVSTNKTDFYRESAHFDFMKAVALPEFAENNPGKKMTVWSSASSSGEEAYTVAIVISEFLENNKKFDFSVFGTDISTRTKFERLNLMDNSYSNVPKEFDIIFCRNVLIYFDRETQEKVINKLCLHLKKGGYFFLGHSESVSGINVPLRQIKPTIFERI